MPCNIPVREGVKQAEDCKCYKAVMLTYKCMSDDEPAHVALEAAQRVYRFHHPEDSKVDAHLTVERWVNEDRVQ